MRNSVLLLFVPFVAVCIPAFAATSAASGPWPASDPHNLQHWVKNMAFWDDFAGSALDSSKWYAYCPQWTGRDPSEFDPANVSVSGGALHLKMINKNLVKDGSFETGTLAAWTSWGSGTKTIAGRSPAYRSGGCVCIDGQGAVEQIVDLAPNTTYKLTGYARCDTGTGVTIGVKNYGGPEVYNTTAASTYQGAYIEFTTGAHGPIRATVYVFNSGGTGVVYGDEVAVVPKILTDGFKLTGDNSYTSSCVESIQKAGFGYYEAKMKAADATSTSSFWFSNLIQEIDVQEAVPESQLNPANDSFMNMTTHYFSGGGDTSNHGTYDTGKRLDAAYHIYGLNWNASTINFFFDGALVRSIPNVTNTDPESMLFDTEIFEWDGMPPYRSSSTFDIAYIRAWSAGS